MVTNKLIDFLMTVMVMFGPLIWIYLILYTLNWNDRKNLFSDSWIILIVLVISSFAVFLGFVIVDANSYRLLHWTALLLFLLILVLVNTFSVAAVLDYRENKRLLSIADNGGEEINQNSGNKNILKTSAIVSILTIAMVSSLVMFINEVSEIREKSKPTPDYGIYD